jgi:hypothetical protein
MWNSIETAPRNGQLLSLKTETAEMAGRWSLTHPCADEIAGFGWHSQDGMRRLQPTHWQYDLSLEEVLG